MPTDPSAPTPPEAALRAFVADFQRRISAWGWWTDALFVACTSPKEREGVYASELRVYVVGPEADTPPACAWRRETLRDRLWISLLLPDAIDLTLEGRASSMRPAASADEIETFLAVLLARSQDEHVLVDYRWIHHPDLNSPGRKVLADDLTWVCAAVAEMQLGTPALP